MANYETLKSAIQQVVKTNGNNEITGALLQQNLLAMINSLGVGYQFVGIATPTTNPGTPDQRIFYIASAAGQYSNFNNLIVNDDEIVILKYDSAWRKEIAAKIPNISKVDGVIIENGLKKSIGGNGIGNFFFEIPLLAGREYKIYNTSLSGTINLNTRVTKDGTDVQQINSIAPGGYKTFVATTNTNWIRLYCTASAQTCEIENLSTAFAMASANKTSIDLLNEKIEMRLLGNSSGVGSAFYDFPLKTGKQYKITNTGNTGTINVMSASAKSSGNVVETFKNGLSKGASFVFIPTINAPYLQIYFAASGSFEIVNNESIIPRIETIEEKVENAELNISSLQQSSVKINELTPLIETENLMFYQLVGYLVDASTGQLVASAGQSYTIIDLSGKKLRTLTFTQAVYGGNYGYGFFLDDNTWVGVHTTTVETVTIEVPEKAVEFRLCWSAGQVQTQTITATSFLSAEEIKKEANKVHLSFPFYPDWDLSKVPQQVVEPVASTMAEFYSIYDELVTNYPNWVSKIDCDSEIGLVKPEYLDSTTPIYMYKFSPKRTNTLSDAGNRLKVFIVSGIHSNETMGMYILNRFFKMLATNWKNDKNIEQLRTLVDFYVIPCVNPWGFVNRTNTGERGVAIPGRANGNGVNLNRNFPTKNWVLSGSPTASDSNYSGATAGSEYESKILIHYINEIHPDACFDVHTGGMTVGGAYGSVEIHENASDELVSMLIGMGRAICNQWIIEDTDFPQGVELSAKLFDVNISTVSGEFHRWVYENGLKISVLTEESIFQNWVNGVLQSTNQYYNTNQIWRENLQSVYNTIMRITHAASVEKYGSK